VGLVVDRVFLLLGQSELRNREVRTTFGGEFGHEDLLILSMVLHGFA